MRATWFDGLQTKAEMNSLTIGEIESIMGDLSTNADSKVLEVARALDCLNKAWDAKKTLAPTRAEEEIIHHHCNIDIERIESLLDFPLIERGPSCKECDCYNCNKLPDCHILFPTTLQDCHILFPTTLQDCHILFPTTLHFCEKICGGTIGVANCDYGPKEIKRRAERIFRNEG